MKSDRKNLLTPDFQLESDGYWSFTRFDAISLVVIAVSALVLLLPILVHGFPWGDDIRHHYRWSYYFIEALREGAIYPRWLAGANRGYGSPAMFYYPPLEFYVVAAFNLVARNLLNAIELSCVFAMMLSGATMYILSRPILSRGASLAAAVLYMAMPYHVLDLYRVNSLSEYWSFVWIPLVFDAARRVAFGQRWHGPAYLAVAYALLLFTHVPASLMVGLSLPVYLILLTRDKMKLLRGALGMALGVGCGAIFLVSPLWETRQVHIERLVEFSYSDSFMFEDLSAVSLTNLLSMADYPRVTGYIQEANLVAVGFAVLLTFVVVGLLIIRRSISQKRLVWTFLLICVVSFLMITRLTQPVWGAVGALQYLQFPLRWLVVAAVPACLLVAYVMSQRSASGKLLVLCWVLLSGAIALNVAISAHVATQRPADPAWLQAELALQDVREYAPQTWDEVFLEAFENAGVVVGSGATTVNAIDDAGSSQSYQVNAATEATLRFRSLSFPGWSARVDGKRVDIGRSDEGNIEVIVSAGEHLVSLTFGQTSRQVKGTIVSAVSALIVLGMFVGGWRLRGFLPASKLTIRTRTQSH